MRTGFSDEEVNSAAVCIGELLGLLGQLEKKKFDYSADYIHIDYFR
jgi:hypothetical protein